MAKSPSKRRGITLGARADSAASLDLLSVRPAASVSRSPDQTPSAVESAGGDPGASPETMPDHLVQLRRMNADLDSSWWRQAEQLQKQFEQLEQQRDQIALQTLQLQALGQARQRSGRLRVLLTLLILAGMGALGFHTWPRVQDLAGDLNRVATGAGQLAPQLQAVREQVTSLTSLTSDLGQMGSTVAALREDVSGVRSDVGSLRRTVDTLRDDKGAVQAGATRTAAHTLPRNATTMVNPYRGMRPGMPW